MNRYKDLACWLASILLIEAIAILLALKLAS